MIFDIASRLAAPLRLAALTAPALFLFTTGQAAAAQDGVTDAFARLGEGRLVSRTVSLADLGIREPIVFSAPDTRSELYLPVPAGVSIADASLQLDGSYLRADGGRTTMLVSLDGVPVMSRGFTQPQGDAAATIGVAGVPRPSGFVRVGLQWSSVIDDRLCTDQTAVGNVLRVAPGSRLTYRYDPATIADVRTAWSTLPITPVVAVSGRRVQAPAFDTAWRVEALMEREGRAPATIAWPAVGDAVDVSGIDVPAALRAVPAFAALAHGGSATLADAAQVGALIALAPRGFAPDVIVADDAMRRATVQALDALRAQIAAVSSDAAAAFDSWRARSLAPIVNPLAPGEVRLARLPGQTAIVVGDPVSVEALSRAWRPIGAADRYVVHRLDEAPYAHGERVSLSALGGVPRTLDVLARAVWEASFDLAAVAAGGRLPGDVVLDVMAAPTPRGAGQIASVYFNDVLIASRMLAENGKPERITAHVPRYALAPVNALRVVFQRRLEGGCEPRGQGYPVAVLPTSHLTLERVNADGDDFTGTIARLARQANVIVPQAYLDDAPAGLRRLARLASVAGAPLTRATLTVAAGADPVTPAGPFLAADVALAGQTSGARLSADRLTLTDASGRAYADVSGLTNLAVIEVAQANGAAGIAYRTLGAKAPQLPAALQLVHGDVALVSANAPAQFFDSRHPGEPATAATAADDRDWAGWPWMVAGGIVGLIVLLLASHFVRRRHQSKDRA
ncbi:cellulose synthase [Trinickia caryophylli]|uniref:Cellulose synthase subunit n=1 Tax=Trinickia caryophylli TaxID=28094 RepID=A0A1X7F2T8_TRICW|nr:cellulose synthase [Trinickia caryophylli]PMS10379.1 cellulose synthase [Trinickia caryophylli]TRX19498.1 cellulose biosynthesis cyclic di-GMP-binding regulatory protein BcsB [Trinickia caryophylli]WQE13193.1 cellulose synthase [Trinickia caryophylli]SMF44666.1 cellulose synthase subunit [Trinickia caryophylli]GLU34498.1 membrane protein [Trinickia caryophylli]